jgi:hypothetical protein
MNPTAAAPAIATSVMMIHRMFSLSKGFCIVSVGEGCRQWPDTIARWGCGSAIAPDTRDDRLQGGGGGSSPRTSAFSQADARVV